MGATAELASYILSTRLADLPADVKHEAHRALLNYVGCALGGSREPAVDIALRALDAVLRQADRARSSAAPSALDPLHASLMNGISSHVYDFDDTTPKNYIHPTSPVASALFAYASANRVTGARFHARRSSSASKPNRASATRCIRRTTTSAGTSPARPECSARRRRSASCSALPAQQMIWAIGLAATQAAGLREMFGSMGKAFHPGRAAQNGYAAALLAREGFTGSDTGIEGPRGFARGAGREVRSVENHDPPRRSISICARTPTSRFRAAS